MPKFLKKKYRTQNVVLEQSDHDVVSNLAEEMSLGGKGFSVALRMIIREWNAARGGRYSITEAGREALKEEKELA